MDRLGTRKGFSTALVVWSLAAMAHALVGSVMGFGVARFMLGLGESGSFPASIKTVAEWFPKKERALATGIFNSGTNIGAVIAPLTVPFIAEAYGWRLTFIITGAIGLIWLLFWFLFYEVPSKHKKLSKEEYEYIHSDVDEKPTETVTQEKVSWFKLLKFNQTWAFTLGKML